MMPKWVQSELFRLRSDVAIERFVADRFREIGNPEADAAAIDAAIAAIDATIAAIDAAIAEAEAYWRGRINARLADDEEYVGEAEDRGHQ